MIPRLSNIYRRTFPIASDPQPPPRPRLRAVIYTEMRKGICGWWPSWVNEARSPDSFYARLTAGKYCVEVIELKRGGWMIARLDLAVHCTTLTEAVEMFRRYVENQVSQFVEITTDPR